MHVTMRAATADDTAFLESMLVESVNWLPDRNLTKERILAEMGHYVAGWPRPTDLGVIALDPDGRPIGAAWLRYHDAEQAGYGFVAADVPELSIAVAARWRGQGVGRALLHELHARRTGPISLSVERANPAIELYRSEGYRTVSSGRDSDTMIRDT